MATVTVFGDSSDGNVTSDDATYANARNGTGTLNLNQSSGDLYFGQGNESSVYYVREAFLAFDTSSVVAPLSVVLSIYVTDKGVGSNMGVTARLKDWGSTLETADFVPGASMSGDTDAATATVGGWSVNAYNSFSSSGSPFTNGLNLTGMTRLYIHSNATANNAPPGVPEINWVKASPSEASGTTQDPKLVITVVTPSTGNVLYPDIDQATNSWTTDTGGTSNLYQAIDEVSPSDSDYIQSPVAPTSSQFYETRLQTHSDPGSSLGHIVHYRYQKNVTGGNVDLVVSLRQGASTEIASWTHTNISNSWTTQNQTLTGAQADAITDYSDLRMRFAPSMVSSDIVPAKVADRATANSNAAVTTVDLVLSSLTVGNLLIIRTSADNSGGGGAARTITVTNQSGTAINTTLELNKQANNDPGAASAGVTANLIAAKITGTSGTVRLTYSGSVVQACVAEEWSGLDPTTPIVGTGGGGGSNVNTTALPTQTDPGVAIGNLIYISFAVEGPSSDTYTVPTGVLGGSFVALTKAGTTNATADTNQTSTGAYKVPTTADAQSSSGATVSVARDSALWMVEMQAAPATIKDQVSWVNFELPSITRKRGLSTGMDSGYGVF